MTDFKAVVFDWAGTLVDFGSIAPVEGFRRAFGQFGVDATPAETRGPMGLGKHDHIRQMLAMPRLSAQWLAANGGRAPSDNDVERIYQQFEEQIVDAVADRATPIPGAAETLAALRARGIKIGSTTGYPRAIMNRLHPVASRHGVDPDAIVCVDEVPEGRPAPFAMYKCFIELGVYPPSSVVKVDDTAPGIAEGLAAGCRTIGIALSGNEVGLSEEDIAVADPGVVSKAAEKARDKLSAAGADIVIDTVAELPEALARL
ncbi:MAG: phosphonoacetaldehyde hydrolase [Pseudomonadota bacterium]